MSAQGKLAKVKQESNESFGDFYVRFMDFANKSKFNEEALMWTLMERITPEFRERLKYANKTPTSFDELKETLLDMDAMEYAFQEADLSTISSPYKIVGRTTSYSRRDNQGRFLPNTRGNFRSNFQSTNRQQYQRRDNQGQTEVVTETKKAVTGLPNTRNNPPPQPPATPQARPNPPSNQPQFPWASREERQRRRDQGLCLGCGGEGHFIGQCPHRQVIARRASTLTETSNVDQLWATYDDGTHSLIDLENWEPESDVEDEEFESENTSEAQEN